ncbi:MAG: GxxExxY protein [Bacteroidota bacterium]|nr:GxxExxY protein [Bacteroidota bacterium]MDP3143880.1 GxxExxY protein [Bacteroidota bacterium]
METLLHENITEQIIKTYYEVYNKLGYGFLERVYQNAMLFELKNKGLDAEAQKMIKVHYKGFLVGDYFADIIVENSVILELKASEVLVHENELQLLNYLRATDIEVGLLLNFGKKAEFRRKIFTNDRKCLKSEIE